MYQVNTLTERPRTTACTETHGLKAAPYLIVSLTLVSTLMIACGRGFRVLDAEPALATGDATVTGIVTGSAEHGVPLANRTVVGVNAATGDRYTAITNVAGGYTLKLPAGNYSFEVDLGSGESLGKRPKNGVKLEVGEIETHMDFQVYGTGVATAQSK
jgi:hypothetical protein